MTVAKQLRVALVTRVGPGLGMELELRPFKEKF